MTARLSIYRPTDDQAAQAENVAAEKAETVEVARRSTADLLERVAARLTRVAAKLRRFRRKSRQRSAQTTKSVRASRKPKS